MLWSCLIGTATESKSLGYRWASGPPVLLNELKVLTWLAFLDGHQWWSDHSPNSHRIKLWLLCKVRVDLQYFIVLIKIDRFLFPINVHINWLISGRDSELEIWSIYIRVSSPCGFVVEFVCSVANLEVNYIMVAAADDRMEFREACLIRIDHHSSDPPTNLSLSLKILHYTYSVV